MMADMLFFGELLYVLAIRTPRFLQDVLIHNGGGETVNQ
jgi:hypothetical protein